MTVTMLPNTIERTKLLAKFADLLERTQSDMIDLAHAYKACVDAGVDMSRYGKSLGMRLLKIADGALVPKTTAKVLALPDATVRALASLPRSVQDELWEHGVEIWRDDQPKRITVDDLRSAEARRLVDVCAGKGRLLSPLEQKERMTPAVVKRDQVLSVRLTYEEARDARAWAHKKGKSLETLIREMIRNEVE